MSGVPMKFDVDWVTGSRWLGAARADLVDMHGRRFAVRIVSVLGVTLAWLQSRPTKGRGQHGNTE